MLHRAQRHQADKKASKLSLGLWVLLSGDAASYGLSILKGAQLAIKEAGLTNVKLVTEDSKCDPKEAVSAINKLISVNKVRAIVGEVCSGATLAAAPIAEQNKVVMISAASTSPEISKQAWVFRTVPSDALQGAFGAELVAKNGYKKLAILYSNEEYGLGFSKVLQEEFPKQGEGGGGEGREVVANEAVERGVVDLRTQLTKIKASGADAIYIISNSPDSSVAALKQIKELGINAAVYGSEGLKSDDLVKGAGSAAEGLVVTSVSVGNVGFITKHQREYGSEPGPFAAQAYDAFKALAEAMKMGAVTGEQFKEKLALLSLTGPLGISSLMRMGMFPATMTCMLLRMGNGCWAKYHFSSEKYLRDHLLNCLCSVTLRHASTSRQF